MIDFEAFILDKNDQVQVFSCSTATSIFLGRSSFFSPTRLSLVSVVAGPGLWGRVSVALGAGIGGAVRGRRARGGGAGAGMGSRACALEGAGAPAAGRGFWVLVCGWVCAGVLGRFRA